MKPQNVNGTPICEWDQPEPAWVPLEIAPLYFTPHFAAAGYAWSRQTTSFARRRMTVGMSVDSQETSLRFKTPHYQLELDGAAGEFWLEARESVNLDPDDFGFSLAGGQPHEFFHEAHTLRVKSGIPVELESLIWFADSLWRDLETQLERALTAGVAQLVGRKGQLLANFTRVGRDLKQHFSWCPNNRTSSGEINASVLRGPNQQKIFTPYVIPQTLPLSRLEGMRKRREEITSIIVGLIESSPQKRTKNKRQIRALVDQQVGFEVSDSEFASCRRVAIERVPGAKGVWDRPGAPFKEA